MTFPELKKINDKIKAIEQELEGSATKEDTKHILEELDKFNQELNKYKSIISNQKEMNIKTKEDMLRLKEEFDEIKQDFSSLNNLLENNSLNKLIENINNITDKFVEKSLYENDMKLINKKISKLQMDVNEHNRNFAELMPKLEGILDIELFFQNFPEDIPCWSTGRLLEILDTVCYHVQGEHWFNLKDLGDVVKIIQLHHDDIRKFDYSKLSNND